MRKPKLCVVSVDDAPIYVDITKQPMRNRVFTLTRRRRFVDVNRVRQPHDLKERLRNLTSALVNQRARW